MPRFDAARAARYFEGRPAEMQFSTQKPQAAVNRRSLGMIPGERAEIEVHSSGCTILLRHSWRKLWARVGKPPKGFMSQCETSASVKKPNSVQAKVHIYLALVTNTPQDAVRTVARVTVTVYKVGKAFDPHLCDWVGPFDTYGMHDYNCPLKQEETQSKLSKVHKNKEIFEQISSGMVQIGFDKSCEQCRTKVKKLKPRFETEANIYNISTLHRAKQAPTEPEAQSPKSGFPRGLAAVRADLTNNPGELGGRLTRRNTRFREAISVTKRVGVALWYLATRADYRILSHLFGVGRSSVCTIVHETNINVYMDMIVQRGLTVGPRTSRMRLGVAEEAVLAVGIHLKILNTEGFVELYQGYKVSEPDMPT
uniref:Myb/SANT-like DNA-binding domain-containing protein n=1 Tax=Branchiostoma floridae TaxID=7739 RepID=C3ZAZ1_BRAFL|eukprot:XP_002594017.1 hypothetical protein BRAFLDRAFT_118812 [Branchiostoma floridae]